MISVSPFLMVVFRFTMGGPLAPAWTPFTNTFTIASGWQLVTTIWVSPACTGPICGAGRFEHGCTVPMPGGLGGSPGHICCVALNTSPAAKTANPSRISEPPQHPHVPWFAPLRYSVTLAPLTTLCIVTDCPPANVGSMVSTGRGLGGFCVICSTDGGLGSLHISNHATTCWP